MLKTSPPLLTPTGFLVGTKAWLNSIASFPPNLQSFEQVLANINKLNRSLESVITVRCFAFLLFFLPRWALVVRAKKLISWVLLVRLVTNSPQWKLFGRSSKTSWQRRRMGRRRPRVSSSSRIARRTSREVLVQGRDESIRKRTTSQAWPYSQTIRRRPRPTTYHT